MKQKLNIALTVYALAILAIGCTHFSVIQSETGTNNVTRITKTAAWTLFDSKSELAKLRASTSDKTQTTSVGALNAESSGSNAVATLRLVVEGAASLAR